MALTPAAAVLAAEYGGVLLGWLKSRGQVSNVAEHVYAHRRGLVGGFFTLVIACYLIAAFWFAPKADVRQSFVPVISQIQAMQAQGKEVVLYQANERIAGAGVFYMQGYLTILQTPEELKRYLAAKPGNVALVDNTDRLDVPVTVVKEMAINRQPYYFVEQ
jgi:hypothetical protein